jgi:DNA repair protein RecO (recombination protein O)
MVSFMLKGVRKRRKSGFRGALFQPLTQLDVVFNYKNKNTLEYLKEVNISSSYNHVHTDIVKSTITLFFSEILTQIISGTDGDPQLFDYLSTAFLLLDDAKRPANLPLKILLDMSRFYGFYPAKEMMLDGVFHYDNIQEPAYINSGKTASLEVSEAIMDLMGMDFDKVEDYRMGRKLRSQTLEVLIDFYQIHLHTFKKPSSLEILGQIFD